MFDKFLKMFGQPVSATEEPAKVEPKTRKPRISEKDKATARKEPYVRVLESDPRNGYFELDWNSYFIDELKKSGYTGVTDEEVVDKWFKALCQAVATDSETDREVRIV
jgi:hypothetical protein